MTFTQKQLQKMVYRTYKKDDPDGLFLLESQVTNWGKWTATHRGVFQYKDKYYETFWTEQLVKYPQQADYEYWVERDCVEVVPKDVMVRAWVPIGSDMK